VGLRPLVCFANPGTTQQFQLLIYARAWQKTNCGATTSSVFAPIKRPLRAVLNSRGNRVRRATTAKRDALPRPRQRASPARQRGVRGAYIVVGVNNKIKASINAIVDERSHLLLVIQLMIAGRTVVQMDRPPDKKSRADFDRCELAHRNQISPCSLLSC
jgi:hypothetical protein